MSKRKATPDPLAAEPLGGLPGVRHAFFTRTGGVSEGIYASLNVGFGSGDIPANVRENRRRAMAALGDPAPPLNTVHQVHGREVAKVEAPWELTARPKADALVTDRPGIAIGVLAADCAPVLFADARGGVVGAAHAGWRGAIGGVLAATVAAMEALGASRRSIRAAVGPAIGLGSYEVGPEFPDAFLDKDTANKRFFRPADRPEHFMFDLPGFVVSELKALRVAEVEALDRDTCAEDSLFFSYRRSCLRGEPDYGRCLSAIVIEG